MPQTPCSSLLRLPFLFSYFRLTKPRKIDSSRSPLGENVFSLHRPAEKTITYHVKLPLTRYSKNAILRRSRVVNQPQYVAQTTSISTARDPDTRPSPHHLLPLGRSTSFPATGSARTRRCQLTTGSPWPYWSIQGPVPICRPTRQRQLSDASVAEPAGAGTRRFPLGSILYICVAARAPPVLLKKPARWR